MTVSLSDLKSKRAAMTQGEWRTSDPAEYITCDAGLIGDTYSGRPEDIENAAGIVATHNAADVLIELAVAALAWEAAKKAMAGAWNRFQFEEIGAQCVKAHGRYLEALGKVSQ